MCSHGYDSNTIRRNCSQWPTCSVLWELNISWREISVNALLLPAVIKYTYIWGILMKCYFCTILFRRGHCILNSIGFGGRGRLHSVTLGSIQIYSVVQDRYKLRCPLCLTNKALCLEDVGGTGSIYPRFLDPGSSWWVLSFIPLELYPRGQSPR
jgi:hypothetical protein